jgi:hypothetical protein
MRVSSSSQAYVPQDIPNYCIHFQTILFSLSRRGESAWLLPLALCGTCSPEFSVSPESASTRLTRFVSRFTLFELPAYVYSHYCPAIAFWPVDKPRPISDMKGVFSFFDFNFR